MNKRFKNFLKQIESEFENPTDEELHYIFEEAKQYLINGTIPETKLGKQLAYKAARILKDQAENKILPQMPSEAWRRDHGDMSQPLDWSDTSLKPERGPN